jgi:arginyl-tRNA synthetase
MVQPNGQTAYKSSRAGEPFPFARAQAVANVIGAEQAYPQKVISAVMRKMGYGEQADACIHLSYEHVVLPEGKFSGRKGTWMAPAAREQAEPAGEGAGGAKAALGFTADELLYEMKQLAFEKITAENYSEEEKKIIANGVAVAAIRFWFLRPSAVQKITFDYERALSFSGDSGPYIQYAYARAGRILEKGKAAGLEAQMPPADYVFNEKEIALLRLLLRWPSAVEHAASKYQVHPIADCCLDMAGKFNEFYTTTPVLGEKSGGHSLARLTMVAAARTLLGQGMDILGLPRLEKM